MTYLDMSEICRMPLGLDIIVLQNPRAVEIMHISLVLVVLVDLIDFVGEGADLVVRVPFRSKPIPQAHEDDLRLGVDFMHLADETQVRGKVLLVCHAVGRVVVIRAKVDDDDVGGLVRAEVPGLRGGVVELRGAPVRVAGLEPLVCLATWVTPAVRVVQADAWVCGDAEFDVAETCTDFVAKAREGFVCRIHAGSQGVADEFDVSGEVGDFDQFGVGR